MKVGSIVECLNIDPGMICLESVGMKIPNLKRHYTVRESGNHNGVPFLLLEEIVNPPFEWFDGFTECAFRMKNFREVEFPPELEISIEELTNIPQEA